MNEQTNPTQFDPRLLELHLGQLDASLADALRLEIDRDANLQVQHRMLADAFAALGRERAAGVTPCDGLCQRICAAVRAAPSPLQLHQSAALLESAAGGAALRFHSLREIVAVAAMIVLAVGVGIPGLLHMRERNQRIGCSWNLAQVGRGMQAYAGANQDHLPTVGWTTASSWRPSSDAASVLVPNRRHLFPLVRSSFVAPGLFVCPATNDVPMQASDVAMHDDFLESRNVSYANQNMAGVQPSAAAPSELPILGDDNPLFRGGVPLLDQLVGRGPDEVNSAAHARRGQNVLTLDGRVKWLTAPTGGIAGDNIWTLDGVQIYTGREGPLRVTDSHLLK